MTLEEALVIVAAALAPRSLSKLQTDVFRGAWNQQSYLRISIELNHRDGYIKDVGAELWQMLTQALGIKVTKLNLQEALAEYMQQRQLHNLPVLSHSRRVDWGEAPDVSHFCGRQAHLDMLMQWVQQDRCRLVAIVGMGGIGKTMLVTQLAQQLADTNQFEIVVWRSLRQAPPLVDLLSDLIQAIVPNQTFMLRLDAMMRQLLEQLRHHRCLLILDNVEVVFSSSELAGTYRPGYEDYGWLLQQLGQGRHHSSILLTSRETPAEVAIYKGVNTPIRLLRLEGLSIQAGEAILATKGLTFPAARPQVQELVERYQGNPLSLEIIATPFKDLFDGNIAAFLAQAPLLFEDIRSLLAQQFNRLSSLEQQVMYTLAVHQEPVIAAQLQADLRPSVSQGELLDALVSLDRRALIKRIKPTSAKPTVSYTQQPVVMEYVTERLTRQASQEVEQGEIDYLKSHTLHKMQAKDYVHEVRKKLIVQPILARLRDVQDGGEKRHCDVSTLTIWQADLRTVDLHGTNFTHADLSHSTVTQSMSDTLSLDCSSDAQYDYQ